MSQTEPSNRNQIELPDPHDFVAQHGGIQVTGATEGATSAQMNKGRNKHPRPDSLATALCLLPPPLWAMHIQTISDNAINKRT